MKMWSRFALEEDLFVEADGDRTFRVDTGQAFWKVDASGSRVNLQEAVCGKPEYKAHEL
eukprot:CAMPEP_0180541140 /NCGR_PEP_ID=MMETSP1036_2-20121128/67787_1 /TAXON_ID=632150 /ORGANISM="Azadinium spinosum, Strain 3D9" /LENGTH=58 /DNA_ID=CAMNT_0022555975 /DNA_START=17 /DNA_END=189 /DNA_ORIENTATION=-